MLRDDKLRDIALNDRSYPLQARGASALLDAAEIGGRFLLRLNPIGAGKNPASSNARAIGCSATATPLIVWISIPPRPAGSVCAIATKNCASARILFPRSGSSSGRKTCTFAFPRRRYAASAPSTRATRAPTLLVNELVASGACGH